MIKQEIMQDLFKRKNREEVINNAEKMNSLRQYSEKVYQDIKNKWAQWMTKQNAKLSYTHQVLVWGFISCGTCVYSGYLISMSFSATTSDKIILTPITRTVNAFKYDDEVIPKSSSHSKSELDNIIRFRSYLDSLNLSPSGKRKADSITNRRSGLLDSLAVLENYYQSNFKNYYYEN